MNTCFRTAAITLCAMLLGLPAAQAQQQPIKTLNVELGTSEGDLTVHPADMTLKVGEAYRLVFVNWSREHRHVVMAPGLDKASITSHIRTYPEREELRAASFERGINVPPGTRVEAYFIPTKEGRYKLFCEDRVHTNSGIEVAINVTN